MDRPITVKVKRLANGEGLALPSRMTAEAAGFDVAAAVDAPTVLEPGEIRLVPCGFAMAVPKGYEAQVRPRSGLALNDGVTVLNSPGTIDADYRGEVKVILINFGELPFVVEPKSRIAQLIIAPITQISWKIAESLPETARGEGGFGSTGTGQTGV